MRRIKVNKKKANRNAILIEKFDFQKYEQESRVDSNLLSAVYKPEKLTTELYIYDKIQPKQLIQII